MHHPFFVLLLSLSLLGCGGGDDVTPPPDEPDPALCVSPTLSPGVAAAVPSTAPTPAMTPAWSCEAGDGCAIADLDAGGNGVFAAGHTCARLEDDRLVCWGAFAIEIADVPVLDFALGAWHGCALIEGGRVRCWGIDSTNETGSRAADAAGLVPVSVPTDVPGIEGAVAIAAGGLRSCAIFADGRLQCWGSDEDEILTAANTLEGVRDVAFGSEHACALGGDGMVRCWGVNDAGQLGLAGAEGNRLSSDDPVLVEGLTGVAAIAAGESATCALLADGTVRCWGYLGTGRAEGAPSFGGELPCCPGSSLDNVCMRGPQAIAGLEDVRTLALGKEHACALTTDGRVLCWGGNRAGQLGDGTFAARAEPAAVPGLAGVADIAVGRLHTCAAAAEGVVCWGDDENASLGASTPAGWSCTSVAGAQYSCSNTPLPVAGFR